MWVWLSLLSNHLVTNEVDIFGSIVVDVTCNIQKVERRKWELQLEHLIGHYWGFLELPLVAIAAVKTP